MADVYLLIHPERYPSLGECWEMDPDVAGPSPEDLFDEPELEAELLDELGLTAARFDELCGKAVAERAALATRRIAVLDSLMIDDYEAADIEGFDGDDELQPGVAAAEFELRVLDAPFGQGPLCELLGDLAGLEVELAGFNRYDCVAKAARALESLGARVSLHELGTLPLRPQDLSALVERYPGDQTRTHQPR